MAASRLGVAHVSHSTKKSCAAQSVRACCAVLYVVVEGAVNKDLQFHVAMDTGPMYGVLHGGRHCGCKCLCVLCVVIGCWQCVSISSLLPLCVAACGSGEGGAEVVEPASRRSSGCGAESTSVCPQGVCRDTRGATREGGGRRGERVIPRSQGLVAQRPWGASGKSEHSKGGGGPTGDNQASWG